MSINRRLDDLARQHPDKPVIVFSGADGTEEVLTWAQLVHRSVSLAHAFARSGVRRSSFVAIGLPNCPEHYIASAAAWRLGACALVMGAGLPAREREEILDLARPAAVVSDWPDVAGFSRADVRAVPSDPRPLADVVPQPAKAVCSGGSTGRAKIIVDPTPLSVSPGDPGLAGRLGMRVGQTTLVSGAISHNAPYASSVMGLALDHTLVLMDRFDAVRAVDLIERHRVEFCYLAPTMMQRIARLPGIDDRDLSSLESMYHTAAPCPAWLKRRWLDLLGPARVVEIFGSTEGVGATVISGTEWLARPGSVGLPLACDLRILAEGGRELPSGQVGEVFMRPHAPGPTYAYVGSDPARTTGDGFVSVGDMGWVDDAGYLYPADRRHDLIITGGVNVYPAQVEAVLTEHPRVQDAAVIGVPDAEWGKRVHAIVLPVDAADPVSVGELDRHVRERLVSYKVPRSYEFLADFPRDEAGKLRRSALLAARVPPVASGATVTGA